MYAFSLWLTRRLNECLAHTEEPEQVLFAAEILEMQNRMKRVRAYAIDPIEMTRQCNANLSWKESAEAAARDEWLDLDRPYLFQFPAGFIESPDRVDVRQDWDQIGVLFYPHDGQIFTGVIGQRKAETVPDEALFDMPRLFYSVRLMGAVALGKGAARDEGDESSRFESSRRFDFTYGRLMREGKHDEADAMSEAEVVWDLPRIIFAMNQVWRQRDLILGMAANEA